ncbi:lipase family protein [Nocardia sp. NBC_00508]|uniref:lipase family protein n=1 Tax=Nocardia sp. NBC_00508 TaxID=2975992 RepID=UPI002E800CF5|nr:lipase family protein [Nocardia sp. NBC_00508]WUD64726.1 lipase family protein [Nocardia sp. NBC_00508]
MSVEPEWDAGVVPPDPAAFSHRPIQPEDDPFYTPPPAVGRLRPGSIVRTRGVEIGFFGLVRQRISAWQLLYRTCDLDGVPEVAVTTVLLPWGADPAEPRPLVSFQCAIDAVASKCLPSYALRRGARAAGSIPQLELPLIASALAQGWAVSIPDHGGTAGRFGVAREPGYRALDAVRAALTFAPLGLDTTTPVALWGYSGGGLATTWAAEMATEYAPELNVVGAVAGSPVGNPAAAFIRLNGTLFAGFAAVFTAGLRRGYPELERLLSSHLDARYLGWLAEIEQTATFPLLYRFARRDVEKHSEEGLAAMLAQPGMRRILDDIHPGHRAPAMPMFVLQGVNDEVIAVEDVDGHVARYADAGVHVRYLRDRLSTHLLLQFLALPVMVDWLAARFADRELPPAGTKTLWSLAFTGPWLTGHVRFAGLLARMWLGLPIRASRLPVVPRIGPRRLSILPAALRNPLS